MLFEFMGFDFSLFYFYSIFEMIFGYLLWFSDTSDDLRLSHLIVCLSFYLSKRWIFIVFHSMDTFDDLVKNLVSNVISSLNGYNGWFGEYQVYFLICVKNGFIEWFKRFLKQSRTYLKFVCENFKYVLMSMEICCYDLVGVISKTL